VRLTAQRDQDCLNEKPGLLDIDLYATIERRFRFVRRRIQFNLNVSAQAQRGKMAQSSKQQDRPYAQTSRWRLQRLS
jgi:hypothetical protein